MLEPWGQPVGDSVTSCFAGRHRVGAAERARSLHAKIADALVSGAGGDPDWRLVATHYEQAENTGERCRRINGHQWTRDGAAPSRRPVAI